MVADGLIKALPGQKHTEFLKQLNLVDIKYLIKADNEENHTSPPAEDL
jgi:hypothetical protein